MSVSPERLALAERVRAALERGDRDAWLAEQDPELVVEPVEGWPGPQRIEGAGAAWDFYADFNRTFTDADGWRYEYSDFEEHGNQLIFTVSRHLEGAASGARADFTYTVLVELAGDRIVAHRWFRTREEARAACAAARVDSGA